MEFMLPGFVSDARNTFEWLLFREMLYTFHGPVVSVTDKCMAVSEANLVF